jgi:RNA polymerase sigma factor (TIGR02999 family)
MAKSGSAITRLLHDWSAGDQSALNKLLPLVHGELHRMARRYMRRERRGHTLETAAVVNEAYLRLVDCRAVGWRNRAHFFAVSAQAMRRILIDYARQKFSEKRGGDLRRIALDDFARVPGDRSRELIALDQALSALAGLHPRRARVVELRYFGGMNNDEAAAVLGVSPATVERDWRFAKAWLFRELER